MRGGPGPGVALPRGLRSWGLRRRASVTPARAGSEPGEEKEERGPLRCLRASGRRGSCLRPRIKNRTWSARRDAAGRERALPERCSEDPTRFARPPGAGGLFEWVGGFSRDSLSRSFPQGIRAGYPSLCPWSSLRDSEEKAGSPSGLLGRGCREASSLGQGLAAGRALNHRSPRGRWVGTERSSSLRGENTGKKSAGQFLP